MSPEDPRHGTNAGHHAGCRLACCREARNRYERNRRKGRETGRPGVTDATGTRRRIRALMRLGWSGQLIAGAAGLSNQQAVDRLANRRGTVRIVTAQQIRNAFDRLSMSVGPSEMTRRRAERKGWPPPLAWPEGRIDDPAYEPRDWQYRDPSRADLLTDLADQGAGISRACAALKLSPASLQKWCERHDMTDVFARLKSREDAGQQYRNQWTADQHERRASA